MTKHTTISSLILAAAVAVAGFGVGGRIATADEAHVDERGEYVIVDQWRALDTRDSDRPPAGNAPTVVTGFGVEAQAAAVHITVTDTSGAGYATAWATGTRPDTSVLNVNRAGDTVSTFAIVPLNAHGEFRVFVSMDAHVIVDVVGYVSAGPDLDAWPPAGVDPELAG